MKPPCNDLGSIDGRYRAATPIASRWVDIAQVTPPPIIEPHPEPTVVPRGVLLVLVFIVLAMTLVVVEVLLRIARCANKEDRAAA